VHKENAISGIVCILAGAVIYWISGGFGLRGLSPDPLGPSVYPKLVGTGLVILGAILFVMAARSKDAEPKKKASLQGQGGGRIIALVFAGVAYIIIFERLGFIITTMLFIIAIMFITGERKWKRSFSAAVIIPLCLYLVFKELLNVLLPLGFGL